MTSAARVKRHRDRAKSGLVHFTRWIPADKVEAMSAAYEAICKTPNARTMEAIAEAGSRVGKTFSSLEALMKDLDAP